MTTEATAWMDDLAEKCAAIRPEVDALVARLEQHREGLAWLAREAMDLLMKLNRSEHAAMAVLLPLLTTDSHPDAEDGLGTFLAAATGSQRLFDALCELRNLVEPDNEEVIAASHGMTVQEYQDLRVDGLVAHYEATGR